MQIPDLIDVKDETINDPGFIKTLEDILMSWETHIAKIIDDCLKKVGIHVCFHLDENYN